MNSTERLVEQLEAVGISPILVEEETETSDPLIWITDTIHIQINDEYALIVSIVNGEFSFDGCELDIDSIILTLNKVIGE